MIEGMREVLDFWFDPSSQAHWFEPSAAFDQAVVARFGDLHRRAASGDLGAWQSCAEGCVALCILLDQAPRQLFRGETRAFATDAKALRWRSGRSPRVSIASCRSSSVSSSICR